MDMASKLFTFMFTFTGPGVGVPVKLCVHSLTVAMQLNSLLQCDAPALSVLGSLWLCLTESLQMIMTH